MVAWCPLCPRVHQNTVAQLATHLGVTHNMFNSAHILAKTMLFTTYGMEEVSQVLKDVRNFEICLEQKSQEFKKLEINRECEMATSMAEVSEIHASSSQTTNLVNIASSGTKSTSEQACQTDVVKDDAIKDSEIEELKRNIQEKISIKVVNLVKEKDHEMCKLHKKIASLLTQSKDLVNKADELEFQLSEKCKEKSVLERDFKNYRESKIEIISEKDRKIATMNSKIKNLEKNVKEYEVDLSKKCKENNILKKDFKEYKEYSNNIISSKDIEVANLVTKVRKLNEAVKELHVETSKKRKEKALIEKEFNEHKDHNDRKISEKDQKIDNMKGRAKNRDKVIEELSSQVSKICKEKTALEHDLKAFENKSSQIISEKENEIENLETKSKNLVDCIYELTVKVTIMCEEKSLLEQEFKKYKEYSIEAISNKEQKISDLGMKAKKLDIKIEALNIQFSKLEQEYVNHKEISDRVISEKDQKIANLVMQANHLDRDDAKLKVQLSMKCKEKTLLKQDLEKYKELSDEIISKYKAKNEKILADMNQKSRRQSEIFCLMKESITDMAAMHKDTWNQLEDNDKNKKVGNEVGCRLQELESFVTVLTRDENSDIPRINIKKDIFKNETFFASEVLDRFDAPSFGYKVGQKSGEFGVICDDIERKDKRLLKRKYAS